MKPGCLPMRRCVSMCFNWAVQSPERLCTPIIWGLSFNFFRYVNESLSFAQIIRGIRFSSDVACSKFDSGQYDSTNVFFPGGSPSITLRSWYGWKWHVCRVCRQWSLVRMAPPAVLIQMKLRVFWNFRDSVHRWMMWKHMILLFPIFVKVSCQNPVTTPIQKEAATAQLPGFSGVPIKIPIMLADFPDKTKPGNSWLRWKVV